MTHHMSFSGMFTAGDLFILLYWFSHQKSAAKDEAYYPQKSYVTTIN